MDRRDTYLVIVHLRGKHSKFFPARICALLFFQFFVSGAGTMLGFTRGLKFLA